MKNLEREVPVYAQAILWVQIMASVQLALRHPDYPVPLRPSAEGFLEQMRDKLQAEGILTPEEATDMFRVELMRPSDG